MDLFTSLILSQSNDNILLIPETDDGNVEYKLRLDTKSALGKKKLVSQMNWRLEEGKRITKIKKEAHYVLGINDDGTLGNLNEHQIDETFSVFIGLTVDADVIITHTDKKKFNNFYIMHVTIQKIGKNKITEINVAFVGPSQHGKTTTISHLVYNQHDDGDGYARKLIFRYEHEKITGLTSSVKREIIGFCGNNLVNYSTGMLSSWENIVEMSDKIVNLIDLPGGLKYLRTTLFGLSTYKIDCIFIVLDSNKMTPEDNSIIEFYIKYATLKKIKYHIISISDNTLDNAYEHIQISIKSMFGFNTLVNPIIQISNKSMFGFNTLVNIINEIESITDLEHSEDSNNDIFSIANTYIVPESGTIYSGLMNSGLLSIDDFVYATDGKNYIQTKIKSIHKKTIDSQSICCGESGAIQLDLNKQCEFQTITKKTYDIHSKVYFKPIYIMEDKQRKFSTEHPNCDNSIKSLCVQSSLFVGNVIEQIHPTLFDDQTIMFQYDKTIFQLINSKYAIAFIKNIYGVVIGRLYL